MKHGHNLEKNPSEMLPEKLRTYGKNVEEVVNYLCQLTEIHQIMNSYQFWNVLSDLSDYNIFFHVNFEIMNKPLPQQFHSVLRKKFNNEVSYFEYFMELLFLRGRPNQPDFMVNTLTYLAREVDRLNVRFEHIFEMALMSVNMNSQNTTLMWTFLSHFLKSKRFYDEAISEMFENY